MGENKLTVVVYSVLGLRALAVQHLPTPLYTTYNMIKGKKGSNQVGIQFQNTIYRFKIYFEDEDHCARIVEKATSNLK